MGPSCGKAKKKSYQRWCMLVLHIPSHQILVEMDGNGVNPHNSPIVDGLCLCVSCRLGSQCFTTFHPHFDCLIKQLLVIPATSNFELGAMSPCATQGVTRLQQGERSEEKLPAASVRSDLQDAASNLEAGRAGSQAN